MLSSIEELIAEAKAGHMVIFVDDEGRENEGDLVVPADCITPEAINFMATHGRGLICMPVDEFLADNLDLPPMVTQNRSSQQTAFTVSIGARIGITTGISAADRAHTVKTAIAAGANADDLVRPGHIFPLRARRGGVLERAGHTEAAVDLARFAGFAPAGVICEIMNADGTMARLPELINFARLHSIKIGSIADFIVWRQKNEGVKAA